MPTIHARIRVTAPTTQPEAQMAEILDLARDLTTDPETWVEVLYRDETDDQWELTGDALAIDYRPERPTWRTLTSEEWASAEGRTQ